MEKDWYYYYESIKKIYGIKITDEGRITAISQYIYELQKVSKQRIYLTSIAFGGFMLIFGVLLGAKLFGA